MTDLQDRPDAAWEQEARQLIDAAEDAGEVCLRMPCTETQDLGKALVARVAAVLRKRHAQVEALLQQRDIARLTNSEATIEGLTRRAETAEAQVGALQKDCEELEEERDAARVQIEKYERWIANIVAWRDAHADVMPPVSEICAAVRRDG